MRSAPLNRLGSLMLVLTAVLWILINIADSVMAQSDGVSSGKIAGPPEVQAILSRMRIALGGESKFDAVKTLLIRGVDIYRSPLSEQPFAYRILLPDAFQHSMETQNLVFTVVGNEFWRKPPWNVAAMSVDDARRVKIELFTDLCLIFLGRSSGQVAISASVDKGAPPGVTRLILAGDMKRTLELDPQWRPRVFERPTVVYTSEGEERHTTLRRVIEKWTQSSDMWFPAVMSEAALPDPPRTIRFDDIKVNEGVSKSEFIAPVETKKK